MNSPAPEPSTPSVHGDAREPHADRDLRYRLAYERLIMGLSTELISVSHDALDRGIEGALAAVCRFLAVDRGHLFRFRSSGGAVLNTHSWAAAGAALTQAFAQEQPRSALPWFDRQLRERRMVIINSLDELPADALAEREEFEREGARAVVSVAMHHRNELIGFLALHDTGGPRRWSEDDTALLRLAGELLTGALVRRESEAALLESEAKYRALVETTATGFVILDEAGRVQDANQEYARMTGHATVADILGRRVTEWTSHRDRERNEGEVARAFERGAVRNLVIEYEPATGTIVPVEVNATVVEVGGRRLILSVIRDVTERTRMQEELCRADKLRSVGALAGGIAHDFNNLLTAILGSVSLAQLDLGSTSRLVERLAEAEQATLRARELTAQLLTFARGGAPIRKVVAPAPIIREAATLALRGRSTTAELRLAADLCAIEADAGQIAQVVSNLVINASQAMGGAGAVQIDASNRAVDVEDRSGLAAGSYVVLRVSDRGGGIPPEHLERVFEPYFTTKEQGSGLGLAICYSIVSNHGGTIGVESKPGVGSCFTVQLPASRAARAEATEGAVEPRFGQGRVLVMDDAEMVRVAAEAMLRSLGYDVTTVRDGAEATACWSRARDEGAPFDVAIMDLTVSGGVGGREAVQRLHAIDPTAKAIVSSGYSHDPVMASHRDYGFCDALRKPYDVATLSHTLARVLGYE